MDAVKQIRDGLDFLITQAENMGLRIKIKTNSSVIWIGLCGGPCPCKGCQVRIKECMGALGWFQVVGQALFSFSHLIPRE